MRTDENAIFGAYMASLLTEAKKSKKMPPWLQDKKGEKKDDKRGEKKDDKKEKKLPPWLKGKKAKKGKKLVKEDIYDDQMAGRGEEADDIAGDNSTVTFTREEVSYLLDIISDHEDAGKSDPEAVNTDILNDIIEKLTGGGSGEDSEMSYNEPGDIGDTDDLNPGEDLSDGDDSWATDPDMGARG